MWELMKYICNKSHNVEWNKAVNKRVHTMIVCIWGSKMAKVNYTFGSKLVGYLFRGWQA